MKTALCLVILAFFHGICETFAFVKTGPSTTTTTTTTSVSRSIMQVGNQQQHCFSSLARTTKGHVSFSQNIKPPTSYTPLSRTGTSRTSLLTRHAAIVPPHVWTSLIPPFLGLYKSEYTVSLGYGTAIAWTAVTLAKTTAGIFATSGFSNFAGCYWNHAFPLIFYGLRLNLFLIIRNIFSKRVQEMNQRIEKKAVDKGNRFTTRLPFIVSCGLLYYGLAIPIWFSNHLLSNISLSTGSGTAGLVLLSQQQYSIAYKVLVGAQWLGFGMAALGDTTKSLVKLFQKDERFLVTSGIFSMIRHPNYSGEIIGWTANAMLGILSAIVAGLFSFSSSNFLSPTTFANLMALGIGWVGIVFVLLRATSNLEARQKTDYGQLTQYQEWVKSSWGGWQLQAKASNENTDKGEQANAHVAPHLELDEKSEEDNGSGI